MNLKLVSRFLSYMSSISEFIRISFSCENTNVRTLVVPRFSYVSFKLPNIPKLLTSISHQIQNQTKWKAPAVSELCVAPGPHRLPSRKVLVLLTGTGVLLCRLSQPAGLKSHCTSDMTHSLNSPTHTASLQLRSPETLRKLDVISHTPQQRPMLLHFFKEEMFP